MHLFSRFAVYRHVFYTFKIQGLFPSDRFQTFKLLSFDLRLIYTYPPKTNSSPLKMSLPKRKVVLQPPLFRGNSLVSGRVYGMEGLQYNSIWAFPQMVVPPKQPKMIILVGKPMVVGYHHFRKPSNFQARFFWG